MLLIHSGETSSNINKIKEQKNKSSQNLLTLHILFVYTVLNLRTDVQRAEGEMPYEEYTH